MTAADRGEPAILNSGREAGGSETTRNQPDAPGLSPNGTARFPSDIQKPGVICRFPDGHLEARGRVSPVIYLSFSTMICLHLEMLRAHAAGKEFEPLECAGGETIGDIIRVRSKQGLLVYAVTYYLGKKSKQRIWVAEWPD